jgi:uncharacterized membrane protein YfcA
VEGLAMLAMLGVSVLAGLLGALTGLGGGVVVIPALVILFGIDLRYAIGASLVAVIATSCGAGASFLKAGLANVRLAVLLETATVLGAVLGAYVAGLVDTRTIKLVFVAVLFWSAYATLRPPRPRAGDPSPDALSTRLGLDGSAPGERGASAGEATVVPVAYRVHNLGLGLGVMTIAGVLSALVGVGGGVMKVLAMDRVMRLPFKVSTTTSNFMIGVTAAASAGIYLHRGQVVAEIAAPVAVGALAGSMVGARLLPKIRTPWLRRVFAIVVIASGLELLRRTLWEGAP